MSASPISISGTATLSGPTGGMSSGTIRLIGFRRATGRRLAIEFNSSAALNGAIAAGRAFDVAIATSDLLDTLIKEGKIRADSRAGVARAGVGVGVRTGAPRPDITTPDALRRTLL